MVFTAIPFFSLPGYSDQNKTGSLIDKQKIESQIVLIEASLSAEAKEIEGFEKQLALYQATNSEFEAKITKYKIELTTFGSRAHLSDLDIKQIETAFINFQISHAAVSEDLATLTKIEDALLQSRKHTQEQKRINDTLLVEMRAGASQLMEMAEPIPPDETMLQDDIPRELKEGDPALSKEEPKGATTSIKKTAPPDAEEQYALLNRLKNKLMRFQTFQIQKLLLIQSIEEIIVERKTALQEIQRKYRALVQGLEIRIKKTKKADLLTRKNNPLTQDTWSRLGLDFLELMTTLSTIFSGDTWKNNFNFLWVSGIHKLFSFFLILFVSLFISFKLGGYLKELTASPYLAHRYWSALTVNILQKQLIVFTVTGYFYVCINFKLFFNYAPTANLIVALLMVFTATLWSLHFLKLIREKYPKVPSRKLSRFVTALNAIFMLNILMVYALKSDSSIIVIFRLFSEILFYGWTLYFIKNGLPFFKDPDAEQSKRSHLVFQIIKNGLIVIAFMGIVLEVTGYGTLAVYWYTSWTKTVIVLMWSSLVIGASGEWIPKKAPAAGDNPLETQFQASQAVHVGEVSMMWLFKQICYLLMFVLSSIALFLSWGNAEDLFPVLLKIITTDVNVGTMRFSIAGLSQAVIILFLTYYIARGWRYVFHHNLLKESGMDKGIQESMTTITVYAIWIFGLIIAMMAFGLNMTTLTVGFGALGIGIGFGLQNIFNNFISGIILLFERPIQVGDDIEINGTFATIKKTNVRSTVVQTYDNATIMIPNSELISNQVINWSFKDKRLRRKVTVGVEYGSDIELVRDTLIEIAQSMSRVLNYPAPDVIFRDFGDSALIFTLRFWTFIDFFLAVETEIRFQIDKLFKDRGLVIAYPQQDIHIKSVPLEWSPSITQSNPKSCPITKKDDDII